MDKLFSNIFNTRIPKLITIGVLLSIILTASFFYLFYEHTELVIKNLNKGGLAPYNLTLLGKFFMFSGFIPNFLFLVAAFKIMKALFLMLLHFTIWISGKILGIIFSNKNFDRLEKVIETNKPAIKETVEKLDINQVKTDIKKVVDDLGIKKSEYEIFWIAPIVALVIGFLPMPFGYYTISRLIVSGCALYFAVKLYKQQDKFKPWIFGFLVMLYNPIIPMALGSKELWLLVNIPTIYYFFINRRS